MKKRIHLSPPVYEQEVILPRPKSENVYEIINKDILHFENQIKDYLETDKEVIALNSGTAAIHLALIMAGVKKGDQVLCQSMTFVACANPILYIGASPVFIDSEKNTWNMCPDALEIAYKDCCAKSTKPKAIIVTSLYGMSSKMVAISAFAKAENIKIIEDSAEALGSTYKGQKLSTIGDYGILSFNSNKIITTGGGGMLVVNNLEEKKKVIHLATQAKSHLPFYHHVRIGYNYRMGHINALLGSVQFKKIESNLKGRIFNQQFYLDLFKNVEGVIVHSESNTDYFSNHWLSAILVDPSETGGITREDIRLALEKENIESRPVWKPMHLQPLYKDYPYYGNKVCETLFKKGLCLPSGSNLTDQGRGRIAKVIKQLFEI